MTTSNTAQKKNESSEVIQDEIKSSLDETSVPKIPENWKPVRLKKLVNKTLYGAAESAEDYDEDKPRYIRITDIDDRGNLRDDTAVSLGEDKSEDYILSEGDMLFARSGSVGKTYLYDQRDGECSYGGYLIKHKLKTRVVNSKYLSEYTKSPFYWRWVERITRTGTQPNINAREYGSLLVPLPPQSEQRKIASILYTVDQAIQKTEEIIEQTKRVKKGLMQDLFTEGFYQHENFTKNKLIGRYPADWDASKLETLGEWGSGATPPKSNSEFWGGEIPWLSPKDFEDDLRRIKDTEDHITEKAKEETKIYPIDSIGIVVRSGILAHSMPFVKFETDMAVNQDIKVLEPQLETEYLLFVLEAYSENIRQRCQKRGTTVHSIMTKALMKYEVPIPPPDEREEIVKILNTFDKELSNLKKSQKRLSKLKRGLMQDLLTGEVRTDDKDIEVLDEVIEHG